MNINGIEWTIEYVRPSDPALMRENGTYTLGMTDFSTKKISINYLIAPYMRKKVIIHEITHAFMFSYDIYIDLDFEEWVCNFVAEYGEDIIAKFYEVFDDLKKYA